MPVRAVPGMRRVSLVGVRPRRGVLRRRSYRGGLLRVPKIVLSSIRIEACRLKRTTTRLVNCMRSMATRSLRGRPKRKCSTRDMVKESKIRGLCRGRLGKGSNYSVGVLSDSKRMGRILTDVFGRSNVSVELAVSSSLRGSLCRRFGRSPKYSITVGPCAKRMLTLMDAPSCSGGRFVQNLSSRG